MRDMGWSDVTSEVLTVENVCDLCVDNFLSPALFFSLKEEASEGPGPVCPVTNRRVLDRDASTQFIW